MSWWHGVCISNKENIAVYWQHLPISAVTTAVKQLKWKRRRKLYTSSTLVPLFEVINSQFSPKCVHRCSQLWRRGHEFVLLRVSVESDNGGHNGTCIPHETSDRPQSCSADGGWWGGALQCHERTDRVPHRGRCPFLATCCTILSSTCPAWKPQTAVTPRPEHIHVAFLEGSIGGGNSCLRIFRINVMKMPSGLRFVSP